MLLTSVMANDFIVATSDTCLASFNQYYIHISLRCEYELAHITLDPRQVHMSWRPSTAVCRRIAVSR